MKKKTHEEYVEELKIKNPNVEVCEKYIDTNTKIKHHCLIHDVYWDATPTNMLKGKGCQSCKSDKIWKGRKRTPSRYIDELKDKNPFVIPLEEYYEINTPILHHCVIHNIDWETTPARALRGVGCPSCHKERVGKSNSVSNLYSNEWYVNELKNRNINIVPLEEYMGTQIKIPHKCLKHDVVWDVLPANVLNGCGCFKCKSEKLSRSNDEYVELLKEKNPTIVNLEPYRGASVKILHKCLIHNTEWLVCPDNIISGHGCPNCNNSVGEKKIKLWLDNNNFNYVRQKRFAGCKDKRSLPFDFYINDSVAVEYDGEQHFKPVEVFGGEEGFIACQKHDKIKTQYCKVNNIPLLRIRYDENIEEKLEQFLLN